MRTQVISAIRITLRDPCLEMDLQQLGALTKLNYLLIQDSSGSAGTEDPTSQYKGKSPQ